MGGGRSSCSESPPLSPSVSGAESSIDTAAQLRETERNLAALREAAGGEWQPRRAVVYLRDSAELSLAQSLSLGGDVSVLQGAICRPELMVEIEALYEPAGDGPKAGSRPALSP